MTSRTDWQQLANALRELDHTLVQSGRRRRKMRP
jgi:hypothetical protein